MVDFCPKKIPDSEKIVSKVPLKSSGKSGGSKSSPFVFITF